MAFSRSTVTFCTTLSSRAGIAIGLGLPSSLWDIDAPEWLGLILAFLEPLMELTDLLLYVHLVLSIRDPVASGTGILSKTPECFLQFRNCDQVSDRVELPFRIFLGEFTILLISVNISFRVQSLVMFPFNRFVRLLPPSLQWVPEDGAAR